jgi:SPP1 family predicted phage head-tail adaptor
MRSGSLRHRVTLYDLVRVRDNLGGISESWGNSRTRSAAVDMVSARERLAGQGTVEESTMKFVLRYDSTLSQTSKITYRSADYYPYQVRDIDGRKRTLEVLATTRRPT